MRWRPTVSWWRSSTWPSYRRLTTSGSGLPGSRSADRWPCSRPPIRVSGNRLAYVHAFGAYADAGELLAAAATQRVPATGEPWVPDSVTRAVLQLMMLDWVTNEDDRAALTAVLPPAGEPWQVAACPPLATI